MAFGKARTAARPGPTQFGANLTMWNARREKVPCKKAGPKVGETAAARALSFRTFTPYIAGAGSPAMEINCRRNKPFGPGGSTRRLHPSPLLLEGGFRRGRTRIDEGVKGEFFLGIVPPLSGYAIVANDNYAPVAQAA